MGGEINLLKSDEYIFMDMLLRYSSDANSYDRTGITPLMKACRHRDCLETILVLLNHKADVNALATVRQDCRSVLHYAVLGGDRIIISLLLQHGAKLDLGPDYDYPTALDLAILRDDLDMVVLLAENGANVNSFSSSIGSPLHVACAAQLKNQAIIVHYLLEKGANANRSHNYGNGAMLKTPLVEYLNSQTEYESAVIILLLHYGARVVFAHPCRDLAGVLRSLQHLHKRRDLMELLVSVADYCDVPSIRRTVLIPDEVRAVLEEMCCSPMLLTQQIRRFLRKYMGNSYVSVAEMLPLPTRLKQFLLFEFS